MVDKIVITEFVKKVIKELHKESLNNEQLSLFYKDAISDDEKEASLFLKEIKDVKLDLLNDLDLYLISDPAVNSKEEVITSYPGYFAITYYRIAHILYMLNHKLEARIISEKAHSKTGIDIHPGASIDSPFFIDHGTGIVIGETAVVGKRVKIYQGVTLGALSLAKGSLLKGVKRHPTIKDDVTIYSGASILGDIVVNEDVTIGSNVFLLDNVPAHTKVILPKPELIYKDK